MNLYKEAIAKSGQAILAMFRYLAPTNDQGSNFKGLMLCNDLLTSLLKGARIGKRKSSLYTTIVIWESNSEDTAREDRDEPLIIGSRILRGLTASQARVRNGG